MVYYYSLVGSITTDTIIDPQSDDGEDSHKTGNSTPWAHIQIAQVEVINVSEGVVDD